MSSNMLQALSNLRKNLHNVGSLHNWNKKSLNQGAVVSGGSIDNFELVQLGFDQGERICTAIADNATKGHLIATPEDYLEQYETISSFYNGVGERARIVRLEPGVRFECSNFAVDQDNLNDHPIKVGQVVHYETQEPGKEKKFLISNNANNQPHGSYQAAENKFYVVEVNTTSIDGQQVIRLEVQ